jgi:hypothetical protein
MLKRLLVILIILKIFPTWSYSQNSYNDGQLREIIRQYGQAEVIISYPGTKAMYLLTRNVSIGSVKNKTVFIILSPATVEWFIAENYDYTISERAGTKGVSTALTTNQALEWQNYPTYIQYDSIMKHFVTTYPALCHLDTIGTSIDGRLVLVLKISDNAGIDEDEPEVFYSSTIHGDELAGSVLMLRLADYLLKNYNLSSRVKNMVDNMQIWINPLANPDGTYTSGNTITYPTRANASGIDLNRNFPDPLDPSIVQQKENVDMIKFMKKHKFVISANFHSGDEVVNYPWDRWSRLHADDAWFNNISRAYADTVHIYSPSGYLNDLDRGVTNGYAWYQVIGGRQDYMTYERHGREVTIEIDYTKITPSVQLDLLWQYNYRSFLGYLENALYGIHGIVRDAHTSGPVPAKIFITGHDKDSSHVYSDTLTGRFIRFLYPGNWNLTFSANGYRDTIVNNITVTAGQKTDLMVEMKSISTTVDTTNPVSPVLYPSPATTYINSKLPGVFLGPVNIKIFNWSGIKVADYNTVALAGDPLKIDVRQFSGGIYVVVFTNKLTLKTCSGRFIVTGRF